MDTYITIEGGKIKEKTKFQKFLFEVKDGRYNVKFESKNRRSSQANRYYWACIVTAGLEEFRNAGWNEITTLDQVHEIFKFRFLKTQKITEDGELIEWVRSTTELSKQEFSEFCEQCCQFLAETFGRVVPSPGEQAKLYE